MAITRDKKENILKDLKERAKNAQIVVFVNFHGLNTALSRELRLLMSKADAHYLVAKKTLAKKALAEFDFLGQIPALEGELSLVFGGGDIVEPVKYLAKFSKAHPEISILGGIFDKTYVGKEIIYRIAQLPTREVVIGQFINVVSAPLRQMVGVLQAPMRGFVNVLEQIKK